MRMTIFITSLLLCIFQSAPAQEYKVTTTQKDSFSIALVRLMNCATNRFEDCKGNLIRSTSLMGDDYELTIPFPGSAKAIVRYRDWDKNAYIEFRGFEDKKARLAGEKELLAKISLALGDQLYNSNEYGGAKEIYFYSLSVKDKNGFFSMNMEIFSSSTSADIYLLGPEREDESKPKKDFVLLKIYGGIPSYYYYIPAIAALNNDLDTVLRKLIRAAQNDFDSMHMKSTDSLMQKRKGKDTITLNGIDIFMNYRGSSYSANLFKLAAGILGFKKQWQQYQYAIQAVLGPDYVYHFTDKNPSVIYFSKEYKADSPRVYLELINGSGGQLYIQIKIESNVSHPTKRSASFDD